MNKKLRHFAAGLFCAVTSVATGCCYAATTDNLLTLELPAIEASEAMMLTVSYGPGEFSMPHRHDAHTFVYVLEGQLEMQVEGGALQHLGPGDTFYENPDDVHLVSRNTSDTDNAIFLVVFIKKPGAPVSVPDSAPTAHH
jgi:quercetin dioxygenase-like cupin family protein